MLDEQNTILSPIETLKKAYANLRDNVKSYCILSYILMLPPTIFQYFMPMEFDPQTTTYSEVLIPMILLLVFLVIFSIFLYRMYLLGQNNMYKLSLPRLTEIFAKSFGYTIGLSIVLLLALLSIGLLFGLLLVIINAGAGGIVEDNNVLSTVIWITMTLFMSLIVFRTIPTFANLAVSNTLLPMKSAYYYTRQNNKNLILIAIGCYAPLAIISAILFYMIYSIGIESNGINMVISYLLTPLSLAPYALQISVGSILYQDLVPDEFKS